MDFHELREKAETNIAYIEYEFIEYVYHNQSEIMEVSQMADFIKAHKDNYITALCKRFPHLFYVSYTDHILEKDRLTEKIDQTSKVNDNLRRRIEHLKGDLRRAQEDCEALDCGHELEQLKAEFEVLKAETARKDALLQAYAKFMPIEELAIRLAAEVM